MVDIKKYWLGSVGPLYYDADESPGGLPGYAQAGLISEGTVIAMEAPIEDEEVLRKVDVGDIVGNVFGPASTIDNSVARWDGTAGAVLQDSFFIVDDSGHVTSFGGNIKFPAVVVPSADANTLDDYEEGTWTPVGVLSTPGTSSTASNTGVYTKIGNRVFIFGVLVFTKGTGTGTLSISGLPFAVSTSNGYGPLSHSGDGIGATGNTVVEVFNPGATTLSVLLLPHGTGASTGLTDVALATSATIRFSGHYLAS